MRDWSARVALDGAQDRLRAQDARYTGEAIAELDAARSRADGVLGLWGERASAPIAGESAREYRRRVLQTVQDKAPKFKGKAALSTWGDALDITEDLVYSDAATAAHDPNTVPVGQMRAIRERDAVGRLVTRYIGSEYMPGIWDLFTSAGAHGSFNRKLAEKSRE